jgi:predicted solute-binding protein
MDLLNTLLTAESLHTLVLLVAVLAVGVWSRSQAKEDTRKLRDDMRDMRDEMKAGDDALRAEMRTGDTSLRDEMRAEMREQFAAFHLLLKENDFAHLNRTIKALTFTLVKDKVIDSEDKQYIDSNLDKERGE